MRIKKNSLFLLSALLFGAVIYAQESFQRINGANGEVIFNGIISQKTVKEEPSFGWYAESLNSYTPDAAAVENFAKAKNTLQLFIFMGTWCSDSHSIIPKLFSILDAAAFPETSISLIAVDRAKKTLGNLTEIMQIKNVPTMIVMKEGKEIGRVVEYGQTGLWDTELGEIMKTAMVKQSE